MDIIHWSDKYAHPLVRIACIQEFHGPHVLGDIEGLPRMVSEIYGILYSVHPKPVNRIYCQELKSFKRLIRAMLAPKLCGFIN